MKISNAVTFRNLKISSFLATFAFAAAIELSGCGGSMQGLSSTAACNGGNCMNSATAVGASISLNPLSNIGFNMVNGFSLYANCAGTNSGSGIFCYSGKSVASAGIFPQQVQLSGYCNTNGAAANSISLTVQTSGGVVIPTDVYGNAYATAPQLSTTCDNGRFSLLLSQPGYNSAVYPNCVANCNNAGLLNGSGGLVIGYSPTLKLVVNLMTRASSSAMKVASQTATTFQVGYYY